MLKRPKRISNAGQGKSNQASSVLHNLRAHSQNERFTARIGLCATEYDGLTCTYVHRCLEDLSEALNKQSDAKVDDAAITRASDINDMSADLEAATLAISPTQQRTPTQ